MMGKRVVFISAIFVALVVASSFAYAADPVNSTNGAMTIVVRDDKDCLVQGALVCVQRAPNHYYIGPESPENALISSTNTVRQVQDLHDYFRGRQNGARNPGPSSSPSFPSPNAFQFTDGQGNARFNLPSGRYNVTVTKPGYYGDYYPREPEIGKYVRGSVVPGTSTTNAVIMTRIPKEAFAYPDPGPRQTNSVPKMNPYNIEFKKLN